MRIAGWHGLYRSPGLAYPEWYVQSGGQGKQEMSDSSDPLAVQVARLEERMKTMQAEYKTDIARLAEDAAKRDAEAAKRHAEAAKRETRLILAMAGFIAVAVAILSFTG